MQFELMRLSLLTRERDLFARLEPEPPTREVWLRSTFSKRIEFVHRTELFYYVPDPEEGTSHIVGKIGRRTKVVEAAPPEQGLQEIERESWHAAVILIDPRHHDDGQKAGVEYVRVIARPLALLESLVAVINERAEPYFIEVNVISEPQSFWQFARANQGQVTSVTFELIAPNMFGHNDDYIKDMNEMRKVENIQRVKLGIESEDGLELETDRVKGAVDYAVRGGGSIRARTKNKKRFNSKDKSKKVNIEKEVIQKTSTKDLIFEVIKRIFTT